MARQESTHVGLLVLLAARLGASGAVGIQGRQGVLWFLEEVQCAGALVALAAVLLLDGNTRGEEDADMAECGCYERFRCCRRGKGGALAIGCWWMYDGGGVSRPR